MSRILVFETNQTTSQASIIYIRGIESGVGRKLPAVSRIANTIASGLAARFFLVSRMPRIMNRILAMTLTVLSDIFMRSTGTAEAADIQEYTAPNNIKTPTAAATELIAYKILRSVLVIGWSLTMEWSSVFTTGLRPSIIEPIKRKMNDRAVAAILMYIIIEISSLTASGPSIVSKGLWLPIDRPRINPDIISVMAAVFMNLPYR